MLLIFQPQDAQRQGLSSTIDGCLAAGARLVRNYTDLFEAPCSEYLGNSSWVVSLPFNIIYGYDISDRISYFFQNLTFTFEGSSDNEQCVQQVRRVFNNFTNDNCTVEPCSFNNVHQPAVVGEFFVSYAVLLSLIVHVYAELPVVFQAFSGFWYTISFLNHTSGSPLEEYETAMTDFCRKNLSEVTTQATQHQQNSQAYCLQSYAFITLN